MKEESILIRKILCHKTIIENNVERKNTPGRPRVGVHVCTCAHTYICTHTHIHILQQYIYLNNYIGQYFVSIGVRRVQ